MPVPPDPRSARPNAKDTQETPPSSDRQPETSPAARRVLRSEDILAGQREVQILHEGEMYRLRVTRRGKLILQK
jgi:hemin uptake protein HemP